MEQIISRQPKFFSDLMINTVCTLLRLKTHSTNMNQRINELVIRANTGHGQDERTPRRCD